MIKERVHCIDRIATCFTHNPHVEPTRMPRLYEYLSRREFHAITLHPKFCRINPHNTRSDSFSFNDVAVLVPEGDLANLDIVEVDEIAKDVDIGHFEQPTPPEVIRSEGHFQTEVINRLVIPYVRRAIKATHPSTATGRGCWVLDGNVWPGNRIEGKPDASFIDWTGEMCEDEDIEMRFPLEVKLSSSWKPEWRTTLDLEHRQEYRQVLSQIHYYMDSWDCRYGGILTDHGLVIVQRLRTPQGGMSSYGKIRVYPQIPWSRHGMFMPLELVTEPTMALALWRMGTRPDWRMEGHKGDVSSVQGTDEETGSEYNDESTHDEDTEME
jgi:hypothetical protein